MNEPRSPHRSRAYWAMRALQREIFGFRWEFNAVAVEGAELPNAIRFHLDSPTLFRDVMVNDANGVPFQQSRTFTAYNPAYVALCGLQDLQEATLRSDDSRLGSFWTQVAWLLENAVVRADGAAVWPYLFDWQEGDFLLPSGWICGMAQGLAISALVRAHRLKPDPAYLTLARQAARTFALTVSEGGFQSSGKAGPILEEYPCEPPPRVLDGTVFAMLGLYDLAAETGDPALLGLFAEACDGLESELDSWDWLGRWSWYGARRYLSPPHYHAINRELLVALGRASRRPAFGRMAARWDLASLGAADRPLVYTAFLFTKQWSRIRWRVSEALRLVLP